METTKRTPRKSRGKASERTSKVNRGRGINSQKSSIRVANESSGERILSAYQTFLLTEGKRPVSVYQFCLNIGIAEDEFYNHFGSFDGLEREIWNRFIRKVIERLQNDKTYSEFSVREKVLAFYYTLFEEFKLHRSFILIQLQTAGRRLEIVPEFIKGFKKTFEDYFETVLNQGKSSGEVANRPYLDMRYPQLFWFHLGFILFFWKDDSSAAFENTDVAIEKSVNLAFDLITKGAVDSAFDFAKFLYQNKLMG